MVGAFVCAVEPIKKNPLISSIVALSRGAVLVVLLVELTTTGISLRVSRVGRGRRTAIVDRGREERIARRCAIIVLLRGRQHGIRSSRLLLLAAAAAAADAKEEKDENEAGTRANKNHKGETRNLALQVTVSSALGNTVRSVINHSPRFSCYTSSTSEKGDQREWREWTGKKKGHRRQSKLSLTASPKRWE